MAGVGTEVPVVGNASRAGSAMGVVGLWTVAVSGTGATGQVGTGNPLTKWVPEPHLHWPGRPEAEPVDDDPDVPVDVPMPMVAVVASSDFDSC